MNITITLPLIVVVTILITLALTVVIIVALAEYSKFGWKHKPGFICRAALTWRFRQSGYYEQWTDLPHSIDYDRNDFVTAMSFDRFYRDYTKLSEHFNTSALCARLWTIGNGIHSNNGSELQSCIILFETEADVQRYMNWLRHRDLKTDDSDMKLYEKLYDNIYKHNMRGMF